MQASHELARLRNRPKKGSWRGAWEELKQAEEQLLQVGRKDSLQSLIDYMDSMQLQGHADSGEALR